jgi:hypothetical protein
MCVITRFIEMVDGNAEALLAMDKQIFTMAYNSISKFLKRHFSSLEQEFMCKVCVKCMELFTSYTEVHQERGGGVFDK